MEEAQLQPPLVITESGAVQSPVDSRAMSIFYSEQVAGAIHDLYLAGWSLHKISAIEGMPAYGTLLKWYKDNRDFRLLIDGARATRALHHEQEAMKAVEDAKVPGDVPVARLKFDAHVWAAEVNDPSKFGKKTTIQGDPNRPIVFQISTGVPESDNKRTLELNADGTVKENIIDVTPEPVAELGVPSQ